MNCNNCEDIYPQSDMTRWESCPSSIIADADNYYTKHQVDELIESASTCCITPEEVDEKISAATNGMATEQWVEDKHYLTEHQPLKTINNQVISGTGNIEITGSSVVVDPSLDSGSSNPVANSAITNALNDKLDASAYTPTDLSNYYTKSETSGKTEIANALSNKQNQLTAGSGISIVNNVISATGGGGGGVTVDPTLSSGSSNPVANSAITNALNEKLDATAYTPTDLSNYYTKTQSDGRYQLKGDYVTSSELIQYIENLQDQINSLEALISGCCSGSGTVQTRWITMTGSNDYTCSGTTKYTKEKEQQSTDGINWSDTGNYRQGSTILETNSTDCGYSGCSPFTAVTSGGTVLIAPSNSEQRDGHLSWNTTNQGIIATSSTTITSVTISDCVFEIDGEAFAPKASNVNYVNVESFDIPSSVTRIHQAAFKTRYLDTCRLRSVVVHAITPPTMSNGYEYFSTEGGLVIYVPAQSVNAYKAANGWSQYASRIQAIP